MFILSERLRQTVLAEWCFSGAEDILRDSHILLSGLDPRVRSPGLDHCTYTGISQKNITVRYGYKVPYYIFPKAKIILLKIVKTQNAKQQ